MSSRYKEFAEEIVGQMNEDDLRSFVRSPVDWDEGIQNQIAYSEGEWDFDKLSTAVYVAVLKRFGSGVFVTQFGRWSRRFTATEERTEA